LHYWSGRKKRERRVFPVWSPKSGQLQWSAGATVSIAREYAGRQEAVLFLPEKKTHKGVRPLFGSFLPQTERGLTLFQLFSAILKGAERAVRGGGGRLEASLYAILQMLSVAPFRKNPDAKRLCGRRRQTRRKAIS
jgi:hypothetical protein